MTADKRPTIQCTEHGPSRYCIICVHLREQVGLKYIAAAACQHGPAQAWCSACDDAMAAERGWTDVSEAQADFALFCRQCYVRTLQRHEFVAYSQGPDETCDWSEIEPPGA